MKRRDFLRSSGGALLAANMAPFLITRRSPLFAGTSSHIVSVFDDLATTFKSVPGTALSRDGVVLNNVTDFSVNRIRVSNMVDSAVLKLTGQKTVGKAWESLFPAGHPNINTTIAIKLNFSYGEPGEVNDWTEKLCPYGPKVAISDAIVSGLAQMLDGNFPIENILLFDATNPRGTKLQYMLRQGYRPVKANADGYYKENETGAHRMHWVKPRDQVEAPETAPSFIAAPDYTGLYKAPQKIYSAVYENDFMINLANAKTHRASGVTGVMKNTFGCTDNPVGTHGNSEWKDALSSPYAGTRKTIPVFYKSIDEFTPTILNVMDALGGMHQGGPMAGLTFGENVIAVSKDPVALDSYTLALINKHRKNDGLIALNTTEEGRPSNGYPDTHASFLTYSSETHNLGSQSLDGLEIVDRTSEKEEYDLQKLDRGQARVSEVSQDTDGLGLDIHFDKSGRTRTVHSRIEDLEGNVMGEKEETTRERQLSVSWDRSAGASNMKKGEWYIWHATIDEVRHSRVVQLQ